MSDLKSRLIKASTSKLTADLTKSKLFNKRDVIRTRIPLLNIALSGQIDGGLSSGLTIYAGFSRSFKTLFGLTTVAAYMKKYPDAITLFYDSEFGASEAYFKSMGVDLDRVVHTPIQSVEQLKIDLVNQLESIERGEKVIIFIDSIGNTASKKETEDALNEKEKVDMTRAKSLKSLFRIITPYLTIKDIPCVAINHTAQEIGGMYPKEIMGGGCVVEGTKIKMADGSSKAIEDIKTGELVKTLIGGKEVTFTWNPDTLEDGEPECFEIEFEDGTKVITSDVHRFMVMEGDTPVWVEAKDLELGLDCVVV